MQTFDEVWAEQISAISDAVKFVYWLLPMSLKDVIDNCESLNIKPEYSSSAISSMLTSNLITLTRDGTGKYWLVKTKGDNGTLI